MTKKVLVTGGAGYIGSHVVRHLGEAGYDVTVYDNCSTGSADSILYGELILGDLADTERLYQVCSQNQFSAVLHFAASLIVPESVARPLDYYSNNTRNTLNLLQCCSLTGISKIIFSSTAAVYGEPEKVPVTESTPTNPINPYGRSKLMSEWLIQDYAAVSDLNYVILRYFNVAGAEPNGKLGQISPNATHLIKVACDAVLKRRPEIKIFGTDFHTPDGTAIRDYIHVEDLASAHLDALHYLEKGNQSEIFNCGYGQGYSVREVVERVKAISETNFPVIETKRRLGDPACVMAESNKIRKVLNWQPRYNNLDTIIATNLAWEMQKEAKQNNLISRKLIA
jgi:UDP-glucose 4-epimerase